MLNKVFLLAGKLQKSGYYNLIPEIQDPPYNTGYINTDSVNIGELSPIKFEGYTIEQLARNNLGFGAKTLLRFKEAEQPFNKKIKLTRLDTGIETTLAYGSLISTGYQSQDYIIDDSDVGKTIPLFIELVD